MRPNYVIVCRVLQDAVEVLRVLHATQQRPAAKRLLMPDLEDPAPPQATAEQGFSPQNLDTWDFSNEIRDLELPLVQTKHTLPR